MRIETYLEKIISDYNVEFINWKYILNNYVLSESFIEKYLDYFNKEDILNYLREQNLNEDFLERNFNTFTIKVNIGNFFDLSEKFISKHIQELYLEDIILYQNITEEFILNNFKYFKNLKNFPFFNFSEKFLEKNPKIRKIIISYFYKNVDDFYYCDAKYSDVFMNKIIFSNDDEYEFIINKEEIENFLLESFNHKIYLYNKIIYNKKQIKKNIFIKNFIFHNIKELKGIKKFKSDKEN